VLNEQEYFERPAPMSCLSRYLPRGQAGRIELIQHGERIAAVGDVRLASTPANGPAAQDDPALGGPQRPSATVAMRFEKEQLSYSVRWSPAAKPSPSPSTWTSRFRPPAGRASFNLELFPPASSEKATTSATAPAFSRCKATGRWPAMLPACVPCHWPGGPYSMRQRGPACRLTIEALGGELRLYDGRDNETQWLVRRLLPIAVGAA